MTPPNMTFTKIPTIVKNVTWKRNEMSLSNFGLIPNHPDNMTNTFTHTTHADCMRNRNEESIH